MSKENKDQHVNGCKWLQISANVCERLKMAANSCKGPQMVANDGECCKGSKWLRMATNSEE
ncbi:hypothetical protein [Paenibacillus sp. FSL R10-2779]|uniref:hypothetical protein n=1 Tax=Paenibacillus sp. FSL R10-2779 TaxID=2975340 RepID=UPI0040468DE8